MTPVDYGILDICSSFSIILILIMRMGINGSVSRFYYDYKEDNQKLNDYITTIFYTLIFFSLVIGIASSFLVSRFNKELIGNLNFFPFLLIIILSSVLSANNDLQKRLLQCKEQSKYTAVLNIVTTIVSVSFALIFVLVFELGALGFLISQLITVSVFCIQAQFYLKQHLIGKFNSEYLYSSLKYGVAILPTHLATSITPYINRLILISQNSLSSLGIFSLSYRFIQPLDMIYSMMSYSYSPIYFSLRKEKKKIEIENLINTIWLFMCSLYILSVSVLPYLIPIITPSKFHDSIYYIHILALGFVFQTFYNINTIEAFYLKKIKFISLITISGLIISILINYLFSKKYGIKALAYSTVANYFVWAVISFFYNNKIAKFIYNKKVIIGSSISVFMAFLITQFVDINFVNIRIFLYLISFAILIYFYKSNFNNLYFFKNNWKIN